MRQFCLNMVKLPWYRLLDNRARRLLGVREKTTLPFSIPKPLYETGIRVVDVTESKREEPTK